MMLKDRLDYTWELVLKHKAHYFGGFITFIVMAILSVALKSPVSASITIVGYLTYSICLDLYVLADEGILRRHKWGKTVREEEPKDESEWREGVCTNCPYCMSWCKGCDRCDECLASSEPMEEDEPWDEDTWDEPQEDCEEDYDCDCTEEGACDEPYMHDSEEDEYIGEE